MPTSDTITHSVRFPILPLPATSFVPLAWFTVPLNSLFPKGLDDGRCKVLDASASAWTEDGTLEGSRQGRGHRGQCHGSRGHPSHGVSRGLASLVDGWWGGDCTSQSTPWSCPRWSTVTPAAGPSRRSRKQPGVDHKDGIWQFERENPQGVFVAEFEDAARHPARVEAFPLRAVIPVSPFSVIVHPTPWRPPPPPQVGESLRVPC